MTDMTAPATNITWGDIIPLMSDEWLDLPDVQVPYYVDAKNGYYLHTRTDAGRWVTPAGKLPPRLKALSTQAGVGYFDGLRIPASIYAQAVHFFRRVYDAHHTEAEVLITQHNETKEYRLFVPTQRVSHGGVVSMYKAAHVDPAYLVVGTFHSHCDFSAYHSSTDEGDARDMDGIHGTIGYLKRDEPELALMVASRGVLFHYKNPEDVVDTSDLTAGTSPEWWDRFMVFGAPKEEDRPTWVDNQTWDRWMGRPKPKPVTQQQHHQNWTGFQAPSWTKHQPETPTGWPDDEDLATNRWMEAQGYRYDPGLRTYRWAGPEYQITKESEEFNLQHLRLLAQNPNPHWDKDGALLPDDKDVPGDYWENTLGRDFVDDLLDSGLFTEDDLESAIQDYPQSGQREYWTARFTQKAFIACDWLQDHGLKVNLTIGKPTPKPVRGQTTVDDFLEGAPS